MAVDAWKNFELSGKVSDYLAYRKSGKESQGCNPADRMAFMERGMGSYGTERSSDGNCVKSNADWRLR